MSDLIDIVVKVDELAGVAPKHPVHDPGQGGVIGPQLVRVVRRLVGPGVADIAVGPLGKVLPVSMMTGNMKSGLFMRMMVMMMMKGLSIMRIKMMMEKMKG